MSSSLFRRVALSALMTAAAATVAVAVPGNVANADSVPVKWASASTSTIRPGVTVVTNQSAACTSNFVFLDSAGRAYLGQAAHCSGKGEASDTNGCTTAALPLGTPVALGDSGVTGTLAYSSWNTMQKLKEKDQAACDYNDLGLIRIPDDALTKVNPSVPVFGGPVGLRTDPIGAGEPVLSYGNSPLRGGLSFLSPKQGVNLSEDPSGWTHLVYTLSPGVPGDSGSGFIDMQGRAFGVLSTLALAPVPGSNGVSDLAKMLDYANKYSGIKGLHLADGTEGFAPGAVPALGALTGGM